MHLVSTPRAGCLSDVLYLNYFMDHLFSSLWHWSPALLLSSVLIWSSWRLPTPRPADTEFCCSTSCWTFQNKPPTEYPTTDQLSHPHPLCLAACGWIYFWWAPSSANVSHLLFGSFLSVSPRPPKKAKNQNPKKPWPVNTVKI